MLTFDVEEYFQCEAFREVIGPGRWDQWPSRIEAQMDALLALLANAGVRATFFVLGQVADTRPEIVSAIAAAGHEVACHGQSHEMLSRLGPDGFRTETRIAKTRLEDLTGLPVLGHRAATFGLVRDTAWAIDILMELGFTYDSSVQPVHHDRYGVPGAPAAAHYATGPDGGTILEIPPMTRRLIGRTIPLGGGGYFRLFPAVLFDRALRWWARRGRPAMLYLHPWEFDAAQPVVPVSPLSQFRHRVNLRRTADKLRTLLAAHRFAPVRDLLDTLQANAGASFAYAKPLIA
jgi:polysaccharide deacetylase family protein (PEP-CTERM system associated)